jgi:DNA-binding transcriptional ArsR family regulator
MRNEPGLAALAALIADPARARMLGALMSGVALTATELASEAGIAPSTASSHLAKLAGASLIAVEKQGRHRYFRLFDEEIAATIEGLHGLATRTVKRRGPSDPALREARVCYGHLAGARGVWLCDRLLSSVRDPITLSPRAAVFFDKLGIDINALKLQRRPLLRTCLDWTERRPHLAGSLGAAILDRMFALRWARREADSRAVVFTPSGERHLRLLASTTAGFTKSS